MRKVIIMFALAMGIASAHAQENVTVETTNGSNEQPTLTKEVYPQKEGKNPCGRAAMGDGGPHRRVCGPRAKKFPEEICFAPSRVLQICRTPDYRVLKSTQYAQLVQPSVPGSSGCQRGRCPSVSEEVQRKPFRRVSFGLLRGGSTRRFFAQLRSVGSN